MNPDLIAEYEEIRQLVAHFTDAANRADYDLFQSVWTDGCVWEFKPPMQMVAHGAAESTKMLRKLLEQWEFFVHLVHNGTIEISGENGVARWYIREIARSKDGKKSYQNVGLYQDELKRQEGVWRFSRRTYHYIWLDQSPFGGKGIPLDPSLPGLKPLGGEIA